jgi:hypothetical protein
VALNDYRFRDVWSLRAADTHVFDALVDLVSWPLWWPDVRTVHQIDDDTAELTCRAVLPYALTFRLHRAEQDEHAGRLRVDMTGDLEGYTEGVVNRHDAGSRLAIDQRVVVNKRLLRTFAPIARPLFRANHALMMWRGQRGLRGYLARGGGDVRRVSRRPSFPLAALPIRPSTSSTRANRRLASGNLDPPIDPPTSLVTALGPGTQHRPDVGA